jgi:type I restriction-modification system DNA methylase subunit
MSIKGLVGKYENNREHYLSRDYNESQLRTDFLEPFFELLGWDIKNTSGKTTNEREVLVEEPLKEHVAANTKKPDYTFRLFDTRKFFVEAKKPSVKIQESSEPAQQIRAYGFTAKLKISALSNFEYLAIYDCSRQVGIDDTASHSRINLYHYTEYVSKFDEIKNQLGQESVYTGHFDEIWKDIEERLKLFSVDKLFLDQINRWRIVLGKEIYSHRSDIDALELNDIVHRYLNSIIFLRVCEDRNLEEYKSLLQYARGRNFDALIKKFKEADRKYNSGLFDHKFSEIVVENNQSAFWTIIEQLYFPASTYSFVVFSSDILGNIYEIFIGQHLVIREGEIVLENKPEHIDRDIITTPLFIIKDILRQTVQDHCKDRTDEEILNLQIADIACGSGAFLLEAYQLLNDILIDYYIQNAPEKLVQKGTSTFKLKYDIKRQLIENCIFGVDKDFNAVEACKFGLLLKLIEDEDDSTIPVPALPDLSSNIHFGNSLLDDSCVEDADRSTINPYDFADDKYDIIIGNPPYLSTENMKKLTPLEFDLYKEYYETSHMQFDKYFLFIERACSLLKEGGALGYIVPSKFAKVGAGKMLRQFLKNNSYISRIVSFGANQVFQDKTTYTCLLIAHKKEQDSLQYAEINNLATWQTRKTVEGYEDVSYDDLEDNGWVLVPNDLKPIYEAILSQSTKLSELLGAGNVYNGIQTSANDVYVQSPTNEDSVYYYFQKDGKEWKVEKELTRPYFQTSSGIDNLNTYRPFAPNSFVIYPYLKKDGHIEFVKIAVLRKTYPEAYKYLTAYKERLSERDISPLPTTKDEWYRYGRHQCLDKCDVPAKIVVGVLSQGNKYAIDYYGTLISSGGTAGYCMITLPDDCRYSIYYIQALLNSKYLEWFSALYGEVFRGGYIARGTKILKRLPIRLIDFDNQDDIALHNEIADVQRNLIDIQHSIDINDGNKRKQKPLQRTFERQKEKIDNLLMKLYGLNENDSLIPLIGELYETD